MSGTAEPPGGAERPQDDDLSAGVTAAPEGGVRADAPPEADDTAPEAPAGGPAALPHADHPEAAAADDAEAPGRAADAVDPGPASDADLPIALQDPASTDGVPAVDAEGEGAAPPATAPSAERDGDASAEPDPTLLAEGARIAEALIFASDRPVTPAMLGAVLPQGVTAGAVVAALAAACEGRGVTIAEVAGGWAFRTAPDLAQRLTKVVQAPRRLPRAAMEALSIIAYHQPCTRGEIEEIRGAALAQTTLEALLELGLVAPRGRREVPGRPTLWGTTPRFLEQFGLKALSDLPRKEELVTAETGPALPLGGVAPHAAIAVAEEEAGPAPEDDAAAEDGPGGSEGTPGAAP